MFLSSVLHSNHPIHPSLESFHLKQNKNETSNESEVIEFSRQKFSLVFFLSQNIEMHKKVFVTVYSIMKRQGQTESK